VTALSIVVPAFNEAARLAEGVGRLTEAGAEGAVNPESTEIIVVDDGSTDRTADVASSLFSSFPDHRVLRLPENRGKGAAVRAGVRAASGRSVAYMDADMAIHPRQLPALLAALDGADVAIGSRALGRHGVAYSTRLRTFEGRAFNWAVNALTGVRLPDTQCGFKAFRAPVAHLLFGCAVVDRFAFDMEVLSLARRLDLRIAEVSVEWTDVPGSRIRPLRDPVSMLLDLVRSHTGRHRPAPVDVLELPSTDPAVVRGALGDPSAPVLAREAGGTVVLAVAGSGLEGRVAAALPGAEVRVRSLAVARLRELAPLDLLEEGRGEVGTMTECRSPGTSPPGTGPPR
jgi:hypothetical protein